MPRTTTLVVDITCDICSERITEPEYVGAMAYGVAAHEDCWLRINGPVVARVLDLDDIRIRNVALDMEVGDTRYGARR